MCHFKTDIGAAGTNVPIREKAHSGNMDPGFIGAFDRDFRDCGKSGSI